MALLDRHNCRGFSYWQQVQGRGSKTGEPHYGSHAWPSMCSAIITIIDEAKVAPVSYTHLDRYVSVYKDGKVSYNKVELGRRMDTEYELISGVDNNSQVVIAGQSKLADGVEVEVEK